MAVEWTTTRLSDAIVRVTLTGAARPEDGPERDAGACVGEMQPPRSPFGNDGDGAGVHFHPVRRLTREDVAAVVALVARRVERMLERRGLTGGAESTGAPDGWSADAPIPRRRAATDPTVLVTTGAGSMFMPPPNASVFPMERVHARTDLLGLEVFEIAHRACSCTPPRRRRSRITPQWRGASPGTRVEEIATVGAT